MKTVRDFRLRSPTVEYRGKLGVFSARDRVVYGIFGTDDRGSLMVTHLAHKETIVRGRADSFLPLEDAMIDITLPSGAVLEADPEVGDLVMTGEGLFLFAKSGSERFTFIDTDTGERIDNWFNGMVVKEWRILVPVLGNEYRVVYDSTAQAFSEKNE